LPVGSLRLTDLGYWGLERLRAIDAAGGFWLTRIKSQTHLIDAAGCAWTQAAFLAAQAATGVTEVDITVELGAEARVPARLLAQRVPPAVAEERRRKLRAAAKREGRTPTADRLLLCDWLVLTTNVPDDRLSLAEAVVLARARWQIELLFHLWKTYGHLDRSRSTNPWRILGEVYAKLLALLIQHWTLVLGCWQTPARSLVKAARVLQQHALELAAALPRVCQLEVVLERIVRILGHGNRIAARRGNPATWQLLLAIDDTINP